MKHADDTPADSEATPSSPGHFYGASLTEKERAQLPAAYEIEGLAHEIATLRVKLNTAIDEHPTDLKLISAGVDMLVKAVATQYRLSPKSKKDLAERMAAVLNSFGDHILPPDR